MASGDRERNRAKAAEHGLQRMLLQSSHEVSHAYEARRTPMAVVIDAGGRIASPTVGGPKAIAALRAQAVGSTHGGGIPLRPPAWSSEATAALSALTPDSSRVGRPAPNLLLADLDGSRVALKDLYAERTVAIFWNPRCSFCQRMLPDLQAL